jgi:hypothetical protein
MVLNREKGGYCLGQVVRLCGSFRIDSTNDPDVIRDGNSDCVSAVDRESAGLFTVTFDDDFPLPEMLISWSVDIAQTVSPSAFVKPHMVLDSYSQVTRSFQIQCLDFSTPSATDPDDNDMISFEIVGAIDSSGTDAA